MSRAPGMLARNTVINVAGHAVPLLVAIAAVPAILGGLGPARFGVLGIAWALLGLVAEIGFGRATTHFVADAAGRGELSRLPGIVRGTVWIQAACGVLIGVVLFLAAPLLTERILRIPPELLDEARIGFRILAVTTPLVLISAALRGVLEAAQRFDLVNLVKVPLGVANFLLPLVAIALGWQLPGVLALLLAARALSVLAHYVLSRRVFPVLRQPIALRDVPWRAVIGFGTWTTLSGIVSPMLHYLDRFMLGVLLTMTAVTYYTVPFELLVRIVPVLPAALLATLFPAFSARKDIAGDSAELAARAVKYILVFVGALAVFFVAASGDLLAIYLGRAFALESTPAMQVLALGFLINSLAFIPYALLQGIGRPDLPAKFHLLELPIQLLLVWYCVSAWGVAGAAIAWTARVAIDAALLFAATARLGALDAPALGRERVPQTALMLLTAVGTAAALPTLGHFWLRAGLLAALIVLFAAALWQYSLRAADRGLVLRLLRLSSAP